MSANARNLVTRLSAIGASLFALLVIILTFAKFANEPVMVGDLSTYVLPGDALLRQGAAIYVDFFDIKPPVTYLMFVPWLAVFGKSLLGMWIYYSLWLLALFVLTWLVLRRFLPSWIALVPFFTLGATLVAFGMLEEILFITEVVGLTFAFGAVFILLKWPKLWISYASAGFLAVAAGQTKEVFILTPVLAIPAILFMKQQRRWNAMAFVGGGVLFLILMLAALTWWNPKTIPEYLRILTFKSERFPPPSLGEIGQQILAITQQLQSWLPLISLLLVALLGLWVWTRAKSPTSPGVDEFNDANRRASWIVGAFALSVVAAFIWQGAPPLVHYAVALIFPLTIVLAPLLRWGLSATERISSKPIRIGLGLLLLISVLPAASSALWLGGRTTGVDPIALAKSVEQLESPESTRTYDRIAQLTAEDDCIQVAYGWAASAAYLYSERDPCSRFVVPPLALDQARIDELQGDLLENPPSLLVVDTALAGETTYPDESGSPDSFVFPFEAVAALCYAPVAGEPTLFIPDAGLEVPVRDCISREVSKMRNLAS